MISAPSLTGVGLLLGLSLFLGLAFEDFFGRTNTKRPGGIRTFPMLSVAGGVLYLFDPTHFIPFTAGLLVLGAWLAIFYRQHVREQDEEGEPNVGLVIPVLHVQAYLLGAIALALPRWIAVATTVTSVLLLTGREKLHALARRIAVKEIVTAGIFDPDWNYPAALAQRAGNDADHDHAASGLAGARRGLLAVLCELSRPALLGSCGPRIMERPWAGFTRPRQRRWCWRGRRRPDR